MSNSSFPEPLPASASAVQAKRWVRNLVFFVGAGFHPDTPFCDYVTPDGKPSFSPQQCQALEAGLCAAWLVLETAGFDPYAVAYRAQRLLFRRSLKKPHP